jgi:hypothetical protein
MQTALGLFYSDKTTYAGLVQRPQNPGPRWPHRVENSIRLGVAGVGLNGIPAVNDLPVLYEYARGCPLSSKRTQVIQAQPLNECTQRKADIANAS